MLKVELSFSDYETEVTSKGLKHISYTKAAQTYLVAFDGPMAYTCRLDQDDKAAFDNGIGQYANAKVGNYSYLEPFASKVLSNGNKIYRRNTGYSYDVAIGANTFDVVVPYAKCKINLMEIINCKIGESLNLSVVDNAHGTFSGYPNATLDQFGDNVFLQNEYYVSKSEYDATLYQSMIVRIVYNATEAKKVYFNIPWHEVKS